METDITDEVQSLLLTVTPENGDLISRLMQEVSVHLYETERFAGPVAKFQNSKDKRIKISQRYHLFLWSSSVAYHLAYTNAIENSFSQLQTVPLGPADKVIEFADKVLDREIAPDDGDVSDLRHWENPKNSQYPPNREFQFGLEITNPVREMSRESFFNALAFSYYHELAHIYHKHDAPPGEVRKKQEFQADRTAADWMFGNNGLDTNTFHNRLFGAATVLIGLTSAMLQVKHVSDSHPLPSDRILSVFEPRVKNDDDFVWGYIAASLYLHLHRHEDYSENESESRPDRKTACRMISAIADHNARLELPPCP
jgi:hypothetical protein